MTPERARAYGRVTETLRELGEAKLHADEVALIRRSADTLFFCPDLHESLAAAGALWDMSSLHDHLVATGRWSRGRAAGLLQDVWDCGPEVRAFAQAAS
jgi:hypothetical protein